MRRQKNQGDLYMDHKELMKIAMKAREKAYAPYSGYRVGAALLCEDGTVYTGCNIENAAYTPTNCAERTAFFKAVSEGQRHFVKIAVAGGRETAAPCMPCGVCRQVMAEFCRPESFKIVYLDDSGEIGEMLLKELLPKSFGPENLGS